MNRNRKFPKLVTGAVSVALLGSVISGSPLMAVSVYAEDNTRTAIEAFKDPNASEKPMARMWFPDAYAGIDDNDTIAKQIQELADAGFGGCRIWRSGACHDDRWFKL